MVTLEEGEHLCPECKGTTLAIQTEVMVDGSNKLMGCPICCATGKLDWIDFVKGAKDLSNLSHTRRSYFEGKRETLKAAKSGVKTARRTYNETQQYYTDKSLYQYEIRKLRSDIENLLRNFERKLNII